MEEKRHHPRSLVRVAVTCELPGGVTLEGTAKDISLGGMFVETEGAPAFATAITITMPLPGVGPARLPAVVRWTKSNGFGVQFGLLGARETHAISKLIRGG